MNISGLDIIRLITGVLFFIAMVFFVYYDRKFVKEELTPIQKSRHDTSFFVSAGLLALLAALFSGW